MTYPERIIVSMIIHGSPAISNWHTILYMLVEDLEIANLGTIQADIPDILSTQQLYKEYCLGCHSHTGALGLEVVPHCLKCDGGQRSQGLYTQYILHFLFGLETEGPARRALYQELYRSKVIPSPAHKHIRIFGR